MAVGSTFHVLVYRYPHHEQLSSQLSNNPSCCCGQTHRRACQQQEQQQQQQHTPNTQQQLAAHMQSCLLSSFCRPLQLGQQHTLLSGGQTMQLSWHQLWPSQLTALSNCCQQQQRWLSTSPAVRGGSRSSPAAWRSAVPPLHQPSTHVTGTSPLKARSVEATATVADAAAAEAAVGTQPTSQPAAESALARFKASVEAFYGQHRVVLISTLMFCTSISCGEQGGGKHVLWEVWSAHG